MKFKHLLFLLLFTALFSENLKGQDSLDKSKIIETISLTEHSRNGEAVCYSPVGNYLATAGQDRQIHIYSLDKSGNPQLLHKLAFHQAPITSLSFSKDGMFLLSAGKDFKACVWRVDSALIKNVFDIGFQPVNDAGLDPFGRLVFTVSDDKKLRVFDRVDPKFSREITLTETPTAVVLAPNRKNFYVGTLSGKILVLDMSGKETRVFNVHQQRINTLDITIDGLQLLSAGDDKKAIIWNVSSGKPLFELGGHKWKVNTARFSAKGLYVATGANDGDVYLWDAKTGSLLQTFSEIGTNIRCLSFSYDITRIAIASHFKTTPSITILPTGLSLPAPAKPTQNTKQSVPKK